MFLMYVISVKTKAKTSNHSSLKFSKSTTLPKVNFSKTPSRNLYNNFNK